MMAPFEPWPLGVDGGEEPFVHLVPPASEVPISRDLVSGLLADQHPDLAGLPIADPIEGFDMAVFRLGEDLAVRLPRHRVAAGALESELRWVAPLAAGWTFPTQRIVRVGTPGRAVPWRWAVTSWLPGELAADRPLDRDAAVTLWQRGRAVPDAAPRVWIHADLHPFNVISRAGGFGGIIDWPDISQGDPAVDLGFLHLLLPATAMPAAYEGYGAVDEAMVARARAVGLVKAATLAVVHREIVAEVGWRALVELGVAA